MPRRARHVVVAVVVALVGACSGGDSTVDPLPPPPSTQALPSTTAPPDYSGIALPGIASGRVTTTTVVLGPGKATVKGTVIGPDGTPTAGATVRVERLVGKAVASMDVASNPDGTWAALNVLGGSYRVRAWRPPDIAQVNPALFFVGATETYPVELKLERNFGTTPQPAVAPNPPVVGQFTNLVLQMSTRTVDPGGVVRGEAMGGATVSLAGGGGWTVGAPNPAVTDATGRARWDLICMGPGVQPLGLTVNGAETFQLALPPCAAPPTPTTVADATTTAPGAPTTRPATTTTTTRPTTTTTRPGTTTTRAAVTTTRPPTTTTTKKP